MVHYWKLLEIYLPDNTAVHNNFMLPLFKAESREFQLKTANKEAPEEDNRRMSNSLRIREGKRKLRSL